MSVFVEVRQQHGVDTGQIDVVIAAIGRSNRPAFCDFHTFGQQWCTFIQTSLQQRVRD